MTWQAWTWTLGPGEGERGAWANFLTSTDLKRSCLSWRGRAGAAAKIVDLAFLDSYNGSKKSSRTTLPVLVRSCVKASRTCFLPGLPFNRLSLLVIFASLWRIVPYNSSVFFSLKKYIFVLFCIWCIVLRNIKLYLWDYSIVQLSFNLGVNLIVSPLTMHVLFAFFVNFDVND